MTSFGESPIKLNESISIAMNYYFSCRLYCLLNPIKARFRLVRAVTSRDHVPFVPLPIGKVSCLVGFYRVARTEVMTLSCMLSFSAAGDLSVWKATTCSQGYVFYKEYNLQVTFLFWSKFLRG